MKCLVLTKGLHPPWNQGEVVLTKRFVELLAQVYDHVTVISIIDFVRGFESAWRSGYENINVLYVNTTKELSSAINRVVSKGTFDLHVSNLSLLNVPRSFLVRARYVYVYQYALRNLRASATYLRSNALLTLSTLFRRLRIITTSPLVYDYARRLHGNVVYVPAPIEAKNECRYKDIEVNNEVIYVGHADLARLPINMVIPVLATLRREGYDYKFSIYLSKQGYKDYMSFYSTVERLVEKYQLNRNISVVVKNLSEEEKRKVYSRASIFLYPAVAEVAIDPPLTVLEAMGYGLCVIATDVQSLPYILTGKGILVSRDNITIELYRALKAVLSNPRLTKEYSLKAYRYIKRIHENAPNKVLSKIVSYGG